VGHRFAVFADEIRAARSDLLRWQAAELAHNRLKGRRVTHQSAGNLAQPVDVFGGSTKLVGRRMK